MLQDLQEKVLGTEMARGPMESILLNDVHIYVKKKGSGTVTDGIMGENKPMFAFSSQ